MKEVREQILQAYQFRHACREFDPDKKIPGDDFRLILETGRLSPSSFGYEPWKFVVVQNRQLREKLKPASWGAQKQLDTASHFVLILARKKRSMMPDSPYIDGLLRDRFPAEMVERRKEVYQKFLESDFKLLDNDRYFFDWACRQTYIALGNMMTAAAFLGIDSCPIEGYDQELVEEVLREEGVVDENFGLSCMVAFGYRVHEPRPKKRQPMEQITEWIE
jgi:nitroreductase